MPRLWKSRIMGPEHEPRLSGEGSGASGSEVRDETAPARVSSAASAPEAPQGDPLFEEAAPQEEGESGGPPPQPVQAPGGEPEAPVSPPSAPDPSVPQSPPPGTGAAEGANGSAHNHGEQVAHDLEELTAQAQKAEEYLELAQRTKADFENFRRRAARDSAAAQERGVSKLAKELLPAVDNLDRALEAAEAAGADGEAGAESPLVSGVKLVHAEVMAALSRVGIEPFSPQGEPFDPQHHEAMAQQPVEGAAPGTVVEVYQRGYRLGESVLRPARVVVAQ